MTEIAASPSPSLHSSSDGRNSIQSSPGPLHRSYERSGQGSQQVYARNVQGRLSLSRLEESRRCCSAGNQQLSSCLPARSTDGMRVVVGERRLTSIRCTISNNMCLCQCRSHINSLVLCEYRQETRCWTRGLAICLRSLTSMQTTMWLRVMNSGYVE